MREIHPYGEFVPKNARAMIIGSFPIGKFSNPKRHKEIKPHEIEFFFGGEKNLLWKILGTVFDMPVATKDDVVKMLTKKKLAVGDVIKSCERKNGGASDTDLLKIEWNTNLLSVIKKNKIQTVYFTSKKVQAWFEKLYPAAQTLRKISLISPSGQSLRSLHLHPDYQEWQAHNSGQKKLSSLFRTTVRSLKQGLRTQFSMPPQL